MKLWMRLLAAALLIALLIPASALADGNTFTTADKEYMNLSEEGTVIQGDGFSIELNYCGPEGKRVFGRTYFPADFDASRQYTAVVMNHGGSGTADFWGKYIAPELAKAGYICYAFDCRSATTNRRGSYGDPTEDGTCSVATYSEDCSAAIDFMQSKEYVDKSKIYLIGSSMGGASAQNVAAARSDEIAGLIVMYGMLSEDNRGMLPDYDAVRANPYHGGEVLFVLGSKDATLPLQRALDNMSWYEDYCTLVYIGKAPHGFGREAKRPELITMTNILGFLERTSAGKK